MRILNAFSLYGILRYFQVIKSTSIDVFNIKRAEEDLYFISIFYFDGGTTIKIVWVWVWPSRA